MLGSFLHYAACCRFFGLTRASCSGKLELHSAPRFGLDANLETVLFTAIEVLSIVELL